MSSDNGYERVFKLWISLWHLVLEGKRHIEAVCAVLQKLVFDKTSYPKHKNWPAICELSKKHHGLMFVVAGMNEQELANDVGHRLVAMFPECFSEEQVAGPIPWSFVLKCAEKHKGESTDINQAHEYPVWYGNAWESPELRVVPCEIYTASPESHKCYSDMPEWPLNTDVSRGDEVEIDGGHFVVIENWTDYSRQREIAIAPIGTIDFDA